MFGELSGREVYPGICPGKLSRGICPEERRGDEGGQKCPDAHAGLQDCYV